MRQTHMHTHRKREEERERERDVLLFSRIKEVAMEGFGAGIT